HVLASATWDRIKNQESGGILSKESFDTLQGPVRNPVVAFLGSGNAEARNELRSNVFSVTQIYRLGQKRYFPTEASDSMGRPIPDTTATFIPQSQISLDLKMHTYVNIFEVTDLYAMPFSNFYRDSLATFDSLWYRDFSGSLGFETGA